MEADGPADAQNAPTRSLENAQNAFRTASTCVFLVIGSDKTVTHVAGQICYLGRRPLKLTTDLHRRDTSTLWRTPGIELRSAPVRRFVDNSGLLIVGAVAALAWANAAHESYERLSEALHFLVNDIAMAFFFALATKEVVEATAPGGALHSPRRALVPMLAAVGGMAGPAVIYVALALLSKPGLLRGWAIPLATDIAFS